MIRGFVKLIGDRISDYRQYILFFAIGGFGTLLITALTFVLTEFAKLWYLLSYIFSIAVGWTVIFFLHSLFTFRGHNKDNQGKRFIKFVILYLAIFLANLALVYILTSILGVYYIISILGVTLFLSIVSFSVNKKLVYGA